MGMTTQQPSTPASALDLSPASWYAACTRPRHEKRVLQRLVDRRVECFLPLFRTARRWKDRRKIVELPLFRGYIFVRISPEERLGVLQTPSVVRFVCFHGRPAALPDSQIDALRSSYEHGMKLEPHPLLKAGSRVRVRHGCLAGAEGLLVRRKHSLRFVLSLELLHRAVSVEVDSGDIELLT